jgi:hypothetical protein
MNLRRIIAAPEAQPMDIVAVRTSVAEGVVLTSKLECAPNGGHLAGMELTKAAGLSEDESHGQTTFP